MKKGDKVYDRWWPWDLGKVKLVTGRSIFVEWQGTAGVTRYDLAHKKFLRLEKNEKDI